MSIFCSFLSHPKEPLHSRGSQLWDDFILFSMSSDMTMTYDLDVRIKKVQGEGI
jgi:hypothetical protein